VFALAAQPAQKGALELLGVEPVGLGSRETGTLAA